MDKRKIKLLSCFTDFTYDAVRNFLRTTFKMINKDLLERMSTYKDVLKIFMENRQLFCELFKCKIDIFCNFRMINNVSHKLKREKKINFEQIDITGQVIFNGPEEV